MIDSLSPKELAIFFYEGSQFFSFAIHSANEHQAMYALTGEIETKFGSKFTVNLKILIVFQIIGILK